MNFLHIGKLAESEKNEKNTVKSMKNKKNPRNAQVTGILNIGDPAGVRTPDPLLKRQMLCRLSYRIICFSGWDDRTRTCNIRVKVWCVAITLHPYIMALTQSPRIIWLTSAYMGIEPNSLLSRPR